MPGLAGIISSKNPPENGAASLMAGTLAHEPFYTTGSYVNRQLGVEVGWAELEGAFSDCLPIWNEMRDICLVFSGEHFGSPDEDQHLRQRQHEFNPHNASKLVHLYEEKGISFVEGLNGWFSGVIVDHRNGQVHLFNDRYGMNRVYFCEHEDRFYFASEAKALLRVLPHLRRLRHDSLAEFFTCGCVLNGKTLFQGVCLLPGGSIWTFSRTAPVSKRVYFEPCKLEAQPQLTPTAYEERLKATWTRILPPYLQASGPVALSLTGGVDSRLILAFTDFKAQRCRSYTFGGMYRHCADVTISAQVAAVCNSPHCEITLDSAFFAQFPKLAEATAYISDGYMDMTGTADLYFQQSARSVSPIRVTGLNGGELLRRLVAFKPSRLDERLFAREFGPLVEEARGAYASARQKNVLSFIVFKQAPWYLFPRLSVERSQLTLRTPYFDNDLVALAYQAPPESVNEAPALRLIQQARPQLGSIGTDRAVLLDRTPWLKHQFQQFTFKAEYAYDYGMPQWLARFDHLIAPLRVERLFLGRHKVYHYRLWYRDQLAPYLRQVLLDPRSFGRPYLAPGALERAVIGHTEGKANYTSFIHRVLSLELMQRQMIDS